MPRKSRKEAQAAKAADWADPPATKPASKKTAAKKTAAKKPAAKAPVPPAAKKPKRANKRAAVDPLRWIGDLLGGTEEE